MSLVSWQTTSPKSTHMWSMYIRLCYVHNQLYNLLYAQWFLMYESKCWCPHIQHGFIGEVLYQSDRSLVVFLLLGVKTNFQYLQERWAPRHGCASKTYIPKTLPNKRVYSISTKNLLKSFGSSLTSWNIHPTFLLDGAFQRCLIFTPNLAEMIQFALSIVLRWV